MEGKMIRICIDCGWTGREEDCVHPKHVEEERLCPRCLSVAEEFPGYHTEYPFTAKDLIDAFQTEVAREAFYRRFWINLFIGQFDHSY